MSVIGAALMLITLAACTPKPAATVGPAPVIPAPASGGWQAVMLNSVNAQRAASGVGPLGTCASLDRSAADHSADQAAHSTMSHTGSDGSTMVQRDERAGYTGWNALAENVAAGYPDVAAVIAGWLASPGHRTNLLNGAYTDVGFGQAAGPGGTLYWTQDFGHGGRC